MSKTNASRSRRILITGASGFIGSALKLRLVAHGMDVHAVSRRRPETDDEGIRWWAADLTDASAAAGVVAAARPDVIFHLSSYVDGSRAPAAVLPTFKNNLEAAVNMMIAALETGCERFVLAGSMEEPHGETAEPVPASPYAAAKWAVSGYARMCYALYRLPVVLLRIFMVYGPGQRDLRKLVPYVILSLLRGEAPKLSSGTRKVDWVYVDDVVDALVTASEAPDVEGKTIDVGSGRPVSVRDIVAEIARITGASVQPMFGALPDRPMEQEPVADVDRTFTQLGWRPRTPLEAGLRETVDWYARQSESRPLLRLAVDESR